MITYKEFKIEEYLNEVKDIYYKEGWQAYLKDDLKLVKAFHNSSYVLGAFDDSSLVGFIRCVGDKEHIIVIQDLIVKKEYQGKKIGTLLFNQTSDIFKEVRMFQLITDIDDEKANAFYKKQGMKELKNGNMISYFR